MAREPFTAIAHRLSDIVKDVAAKHIEIVRETTARSREILRSPAPDTFTGQKTQEPFPKEESE